MAQAAPKQAPDAAESPEARGAPAPAPPARPAPDPSHPARRVASLDTQCEVHDRHQVEIRFNYGIGSDEGPQRYQVDAYFFIPRNVGLSRSNFSREQFYADVTALMRLDAAALPL